MKNSLNTLKDFPLRRIYYIKHPWIFFSHAWDNCKAAWQRATKVMPQVMYGTLIIIF